MLPLASTILQYSADFTSHFKSNNRDLEHSLGFHSYITCSINGDFLDITSYLNPGTDL